jgi:hypothetical protein
MTRREMMGAAAASLLADAAPAVVVPQLPDAWLQEAYRAAAEQNVLAAVNPRVFSGYFSVCADGRGFGYGNTYPSLDGHQMTGALLALGEVDVAKANHAYVRTFMHADGSLPIAILPKEAGKRIGNPGYTAEVEANGGLYRHWVPGNPLEALASPTYIQNVDAIFRRTQDVEWLRGEIGAMNRTADYLGTLVGADGAVRGGGYYVERPVRLDCDGVTQPHAVDAFLTAAALNLRAGESREAAQYGELAARIRACFTQTFWVRDHFAEYRHPTRGLIDTHGLSDSNWAALAFDVLTPEQRARLWPRLAHEEKFYYGGMPAGIVTEPDSYQNWEFSYPDRMDLAAMGRVWYLECAARARMRDAEGLIGSIRRVCDAGRATGYYWRERYTAKGGHGARKYNEYPANLIRIVERFMLGVDLGIDGVVRLNPVAPRAYWTSGFGHTLRWRGRVLDFRFERGVLRGSYSGDGAQTVAAGNRRIVLPAAAAEHPRRFILRGVHGDG